MKNIKNQITLNFHIHAGNQYIQHGGYILCWHFGGKSTVYRTIAKVGFPALIRQGLSSISSGLLNNLTRPYGDVAIAAMSVVNRFTAFVMCVGLGIGQGYQPVASFNFQAKEYKRVKKGLLITMGIGFCFITCLAIPGFIFAEKIIYLFQKNEEVVEIGIFALRCSCIGTIIGHYGNSDFTALGRYIYRACKYSLYSSIFEEKPRDRREEILNKITSPYFRN